MTGPGDWSSSRLGYRFADERLLNLALTHRSHGREHNERLEFLGDAVLDLVISQALFERKPEAREGALSRYRARLVRKESLAALARDLDIGAQLRMGAGEHGTGGHQRDAVLADALEAVLGAVLLDGGFPAVDALVRRVFGPALESLPEEAALVDAKTALQERLQAQGLPPPDYDLLETTGADHARRFRCRCRHAGLNIETTGTGRSRRRAEQAAAAAALEQLEDEH